MTIIKKAAIPGRATYGMRSILLHANMRGFIKVPSTLMKRLLMIWVLISGIAGCEQDTEIPLILPPAAEPSSKIFNDRGIDHYRYSLQLIALQMIGIPAFLP